MNGELGLVPWHRKKAFFLGLWKAVVQKHSCVLIPAIRTGIGIFAGRTVRVGNQNRPVETDDFSWHQELISAQEEANEQKDHREQDLLQLHRACEASLEGQAFPC